MLVTTRFRRLIGTLSLLGSVALCRVGGQVLESAPSALQLERSYQEALRLAEQQGISPTRGIEIVIPATSFAASSPGAAVLRSGIGGREQEVLLWETEGSWIEYLFSVPEGGLYEIRIEYFQVPGKRGGVQREVLVDGEHPFREAKSLVLPRLWADAAPPRRDNQGNDVRPRQIETPAWRVQALEHPEGASRSPLLFALARGEHRLRLGAIKEPVAVASVCVASPEELPSYAALSARYAELGYKEVLDATILTQAEGAVAKSDPTVRMEHSSDLRALPAAGTNRIFNVFGAWRWRRGNQFASWKFRVDEPGLYRIGLSVVQNYNNGLPSTRRVEIDGRVPFAEVEEVRFAYDRLRRYHILGDGAEPYLFYFDRGEHTITLTARIGRVRTVIDAIERTVRDVSKLQRDVILITGVDPDPYREWDTLPEYLPSLVPTFRSLAEELSEQAQVLRDLAGGGRPPAINVLTMASQQLRSMADKPQSIPYRLEELSSTLTGLLTWVLELKEQPLEIDYFRIEPRQARAPRVRPTVGERIAAAWNTFLLSFRRDYTGVGDVYDAVADRPLDVWIAGGREWVEIIKELADEDFSPATGIKVNTSTLPAAAAYSTSMQAVLLNTVAGKAPDAILGMNPQYPVDYGIRGALSNLNDFPDYRDVAKRFRPGALVPFHFRGEDYALPENQNFSMLFYRVDILQELGLSVPQTWEDVYAMIPELQKRGMDFYYAGVAAVPGQVHAGLLPFLLQRGGSFYTQEQLSALDSPEALAAFAQWTGLYTNWKVPIQANFYNRFRTGEMPIGISDYNTYVTLSVGAPELKGWWKMAPLPGMRTADGSVDRSAGGIGNAAAVFEQSDQKEKAWEFLKWWTSTDIQARFGEELEALIGIEARWNTANIEALKSLPWPNEDITAILAQWEWFREQPIVLGGYFTSRHVQFAWTRVVLQGENPREALETAYEDINRELRRKQTEFGFEPPAAPKPAVSADVERLLEERKR